MYTLIFVFFRSSFLFFVFVTGFTFGLFLEHCFHLIILIPKFPKTGKNYSSSRICERIFSHNSKSQIFVQKFNFDKTQKTLQFFSGNQRCQQLKCTNPQHFHEFFTQIFLTIFLVKSKLSTAKKSKTAW